MDNILSASTQAAALSLIARILQPIGLFIDGFIHDLAERASRFGEAIDEAVAAVVIGIEEAGPNECPGCSRARSAQFAVR